MVAPMTSVSGTADLVDLNERARVIFKTLVETYLQSGVPVGSRTLSRASALGLSSASIRNVMQDLEEMGLLHSPHSSAGRLPTEIGLRLFVDGMLHIPEIDPQDRSAIEKNINESDRSLEDILNAASTTLSSLAGCASLVMVPKNETILRQISFIPMDAGRAIAVLVGADGSLENRIISVPPGLPPFLLEKVARYVNAHVGDMTLAQLSAKLHAELEKDRDRIDTLTQDVIRNGLAKWSCDDRSRAILIVRGSANLLADSAELADIERVRSLLSDLDEKENLVRVLDSARAGEAMKVFIGSETQLFSLSGSSVIAAPYHDREKRIVGVIGVIGPTRLNYARVIPMVEYAAQTLSRMIE